jgi:hypothetical protein
MAKRCGVDYSANSHWVNRRRVPDKIATFERIAAAIRRHPAWLLFGVRIAVQRHYVNRDAD